MKNKIKELHEKLDKNQFELFDLKNENEKLTNESIYFSKYQNLVNE